MKMLAFIHSCMQREWGYATLTREFDKKFSSLKPALLVIMLSPHCTHRFPCRWAKKRGLNSISALCWVSTPVIAEKTDAWVPGREHESLKKRRRAQRELHSMHVVYRAMARAAHHFALECIHFWGSKALRRKIVRERNYAAAQRAARRLGVLQHSLRW